MKEVKNRSMAHRNVAAALHACRWSTMKPSMARRVSCASAQQFLAASMSRSRLISALNAGIVSAPTQSKAAPTYRVYHTRNSITHAM